MTLIRAAWGEWHPDARPFGTYPCPICGASNCPAERGRREEYDRGGASRVAEDETQVQGFFSSSFFSAMIGRGTTLESYFESVVDKVYQKPSSAHKKLSMHRSARWPA